MAKRVWAKKRAGKLRANIDERLEGGVKGVPDRMMDEFLAEEERADSDRRPVRGDAGTGHEQQ